MRAESEELKWRRMLSPQLSDFKFHPSRALAQRTGPVCQISRAGPSGATPGTRHAPARRGPKGEDGTPDTPLAMDGNGVKAPVPPELPDRDWRADPSDGLRPLKALRPSLGVSLCDAENRAGE